MRDRPLHTYLSHPCNTAELQLCLSLSQAYLSGERFRQGKKRLKCSYCGEFHCSLLLLVAWCTSSVGKVKLNQVSKKAVRLRLGFTAGEYSNANATGNVSLNVK